MKALVHGIRVCQIEDDVDTFDPAEGLRWVDAPEHIIPDYHTFVVGSFVEPQAIDPGPVKLSLQDEVEAILETLQENGSAGVKAKLAAKRQEKLDAKNV